MRLIINQNRAPLTAKLAFKDGRPGLAASPPAARCMLDEFGLLGHFEAFAEAMATMAGFGVRSSRSKASSQIY